MILLGEGLLEFMGMKKILNNLFLGYHNFHHVFPFDYRQVSLGIIWMLRNIHFVLFSHFLVFLRNSLKRDKF